MSIVKLHGSGRWKSEFLLIFSQQIIYTTPGANIPHPRYKVVDTEGHTLQYIWSTSSWVGGSDAVWLQNSVGGGVLMLYGYSILLVCVWRGGVDAEYLQYPLGEGTVMLYAYSIQSVGGPVDAVWLQYPLGKGTLMLYGYSILLLV